MLERRQPKGQQDNRNDAAQRGHAYSGRHIGFFVKSLGARRQKACLDSGDRILSYRRIHYAAERRRELAARAPAQNSRRDTPRPAGTPLERGALNSAAG
jgi:hypothetical protein